MCCVCLFSSGTKNASVKGTTSPDQHVLHGILKYTPDENVTPTIEDKKPKKGWVYSLEYIDGNPFAFVRRESQ